MNYLKLFGFFFFIISTLCNCLLLLVSTKKRRGVFGYAGPFSFFFFWYFFVVVVEILVDPLRSSAIFRGCGHRTNMAGGTRQPSQQLANLRGQKKNKQTKEQNNNQRNVAKNAGEADQKRKKKRKSETETSEPRHAKKKKNQTKKKQTKNPDRFLVGFAAFVWRNNIHHIQLGDIKFRRISRILLFISFKQGNNRVILDVLPRGLRIWKLKPPPPPTTTTTATTTFQWSELIPGRVEIEIHNEPGITNLNRDGHN